MKKLFALLVSGMLMANLAWAESDCAAKAAEKKLHGAAQTSFVKKCEREAAATTPAPAQEKCEAQAAEKKLKGAAKNSFVKKCVKDAS